MFASYCQKLIDFPIFSDHFLVAILCLISLFRASTLNPGSLPIVDDAYAGM